MNNIHTGQESFLNPILNSNSGAAAVNVTATLTPAQIESGYITSTSAAAVSMTTPTATAIVNDLGLVSGTYYDFAIDNTNGANTVTLVLDASITAVSVVTGGNTLTVLSGSAGIFRLYFNSLTTAIITRIM